MCKKVVVIGNGAAAISAVEEILENGKEFSITMITNENECVYYRPMLSEYLSSAQVPSRFYLHDRPWYENNKIDIRFATEVTKIDTIHNQVFLSTSDILNYDFLILATGSYNFIPPTPGANGPNVLALRTLEDTEAIKKRAKHSKQVAIIGGGLLGLEMGWQLIKMGLEVTVIEMMERLLPRQLDIEASALFEHKVQLTGMNVIKGVQTSSILENGVQLGDGSIIPCDFVIYSIGVRANTSLVKNSNILIDRAIVVDDFMKTSVSNIYAAGDCAQHKGINYAIWPEAVAQGKVAGRNVIGDAIVYEPIVPFNIYHGMNLRLFSIGDVGGDPTKEYETHKYATDDHFEKFFFSNNILVGGILIGNIGKSSKLKKALADNTTKEDFLSQL